MMFFAMLCFSATAAEPAESPLVPGELRCEYQTSPLGIDTPAPRLSWVLTATGNARALKQAAYQVRVASTAELLDHGSADLWDSGRVESDAQFGVAYAGKALPSGRQVWWQVRVWDNAGQASAYTTPASWEMALLRAEDWKAQWILRPGAPIEKEEDFFQEHPAPLFRKDFTVEKKVKRARAYVCGLGYYELHLNGQKVGDHELDPGLTSYGKRVFYVVHDVTALIKSGQNAAGCIVGNGWYNLLPLRMWSRYNLREALAQGPPSLLLQIEIAYEDGTVDRVASGPSWKCAESALRKNSLYLGEVYDARREVAGWDQPGFDDAAWTSAALAPAPAGTLQAQPMPPIRVTDHIRPLSVHEQAPGIYIIDLGQNFAGRLRMHCAGPAGTEVHLRYGELLHPDGSLNPMTSVAGQLKGVKAPDGSAEPFTAWQNDTYILKGAGTEEYAPRFTWHGFRYAEVTGFPGVPTVDDFMGERLHTDVTPAGEFTCSNPLFNTIQEVCVRTLCSNLHSVQSDCPHRERFGYGGDLVADSELGLYNFDMATFYAKVVHDFADAVRPNGGFTETAPYVGIADSGLGGGSGPIGWGTVHPLMLWQLYQHYGDVRLLEEQYDAAKRYLSLIEATAKDDVLANCIGDHESLAPKQPELSSTAFYWLNATLIARIARVLNHAEEAAHFDQAAERVAASFNRHFLDPATGRYGLGTQANQAFALAFGLVPEAVQGKALTFLLTDINETQHGHLSTGIFGTKYMLRSLSELGQAETAYTLVNQEDFPGWGHMLKNGATTLWEHWEFSDNTFSHNHPMFGSVSEWFYTELAGIQPAPDAVGFGHVLIQPRIVKGLEWVKGRHNSMRGAIQSAWRVEKGTLHLDVVLPPNTTAEVFLPGSNPVLESEAPAGSAPGVSACTVVDGATRLSAGSGSYHFTTAYPG